MSSVQTSSYVLVVLLALAAVGNHMYPPLRTAGKVVEDFAEIPKEVGDWAGYDLRYNEATYSALPTCSLFLREYQNPDGESVDLAIVYGIDLGDFHQPEFCIQGGGWRITQKEPRFIKDANGNRFRVIRLLISNDYEDRVTVYWFATKGSTSTELARHKIKMYTNRLFGEREILPSALIRLSTSADGNPDQAYRRLEGLTSLLSPYLDRTLRTSKAEMEQVKR